jgi:hypothetical protein
VSAGRCMFCGEGVKTSDEGSVIRTEVGSETGCAAVHNVSPG